MTDLSLPEAERLIESSRPSPRERAVRLALPAGLLMLILAVGWFSEQMPWPQWTSLAATWTLLIALVVSGSALARRQRRAAQLLGRAADAAEQNDWPRAQPLLIDLLRHPLDSAAARAQTLLFLGACAERTGRHDVGERVFETIVEEHQDQPPQYFQAMIGLASAKLKGEQLTDALRLLERLKRAELPPVLQAGVEMVSLFQEVLMGHGQDAVDSIERRRPLFRRYLSTRAGYGYALFAAALDAVGRTDAAADMWRDATLLVRPDALIERFSLLRAVSQRHAASEWPI